MVLLQLNLFEFLRPKASPPPKRRSKSVVIDQRLSSLWQELSGRYFPELVHLAEYSVTWSPRRQKRVLGSCHIKAKKVVIARELDHPAHWEWVEAVMYHEMCHAVLDVNVPRKGKRYSWHGREFKMLEARHPRSKELQLWMRSGGWGAAVRSARARAARKSDRN